MTKRLLAIIGCGALAALAFEGRASVQAIVSPPEVVTFSDLLTHADRDQPTERTFIVPPGTMEMDIDLAPSAEPQSSFPGFGARGPAGIRGWSAEGRTHAHIDSVSASYGYLPGPIEPGEWHLMLAATAQTSAGSSCEITIHLSTRPNGARPVLRTAAGWYAGDLHVHSGHSDGYRTNLIGLSEPVSVRELADGAAAARLNFLAVTDHNTASHWVEVDRTQSASPDVLLLHGREITTARGHFNAIGERRFTDFRLGRDRPMARLLAEVARDGSFVSMNHPWLISDEWCQGCGWSDRDDDTLSHVAGIEVVNGSTPPSADGALPGWTLWADLLNRGERLVAVGGSDLHDPTGSRAGIGRPATLVWATALSEEAIVAGLKSGRVFVRAAPGPDAMVDLVATSAWESAAMGASIDAGELTLTARITGSSGRRCLWYRRGQLVRSQEVRGDDAMATLAVTAVAGDWFSVIVSGEHGPHLISNAVFVEPRHH